LKLGSNFAGLGSAMVVGRKQFLPEDRWAATALRGLHEALGFTRHFTDLGEQAWRTKVAAAIARMGSGDDEEPKEENLQEPKEENPQEPRKEDCKEQQAQKEQHAQKEQQAQKAAGSCATAHSQPLGRQVRPPKPKSPRCVDDAGADGKGKAKSPLNQEETSTARVDTASVEPFIALVDTAPMENMLHEAKKPSDSHGMRARKATMYSTATPPTTPRIRCEGKEPSVTTPCKGIMEKGRPPETSKVKEARVMGKGAGQKVNVEKTCRGCKAGTSTSVQSTDEF